MEGEIVFQIIFMCVFGGACSAIANSKGRNALGWFFGGFFLGCIGLIIVLCLSNERERLAIQEAQNVQNRRLQEQLRQEQMKSESLRQHTLSRLDKHDDALGIDTRETAPQLTVNDEPRDPFAQNPQLNIETNPEHNIETWFYEYSGTQRGPVSINELIKLKKISAFTEETLVRKDDMETWEPAKMQAELAKVLYT